MHFFNNIFLPVGRDIGLVPDHYLVAQIWEGGRVGFGVTAVTFHALKGAVIKDKLKTKDVF